MFVNAYEVELICGPIAGQTIEIAQQSYPHLQGLPFADCSYGEEELEVDIMIGADYYWSIVQNHVVRGEPHGPVAVRTRLGYVLSGPVNVPGGSQQSSVNMSHTMKTECYVVEEQSDPHDVSLKEELYRFWDYEMLGIKGKGEEDEFYEDYLSKVKFNGSCYEVSLPFKDEHPTMTARFYDPLGLLSPVIVPFKCMFQEIFRLKIGWDEALPENLTSNWKELTEDMKRVSSLAVPRCILDGIEVDKVTSIQLHGFADASKIAYGANVYIRVSTMDACSSHLLASKTRIAPLKEETIPRLELMAALTLANLMTAVYKALIYTIKIDAVFNWIDSQIVWWWIQGDSRCFKQFVQNRVQKIRSLWSKEHWRYCPTDLNPSDIASRGAKSSEIASSDLWWKGPPFLVEEEDQWPRLPTSTNNRNTVPREAAEELKQANLREGSSVLAVTVQAPQSANISEVVQPNRFSSISKLIRVTALVLKFINAIRRNPGGHSEITAEEMDTARILWYKDSQTKFEEKEKSSSTWEQLGVFKDKRVECCAAKGESRIPRCRIR